MQTDRKLWCKSLLVSWMCCLREMQGEKYGCQYIWESIHNLSGSRVRSWGNGYIRYGTLSAYWKSYKHEGKRMTGKLWKCIIYIIRISVSWFIKLESLHW